MANWIYRVDRKALLTRIGFPTGKIPRDVHQRFPNVDIPRSQWPFGTICTADVIVVSTAHVAFRFHRVFIACPNCGESIPAGRLHQHVGSLTCERTKKQKAELAS